MKSLIVGLGIGELYREQSLALGIEPVTVDANTAKSADFANIESAVLAHDCFDIVHICTPNYTHYDLAHRLAPHARIILVEKPGVQNAASWRRMVKNTPGTRFCMVKNNQYRHEIKQFVYSAGKSSEIKIIWANGNRIPNPGSWFTTKSLAYGGVSRDLIPHLLSYLPMFFENYADLTIVSKSVKQNWNLNTVTGTDYGAINLNGTYDVDDHASLELQLDTKNIKLIADWRTDLPDVNYISFADEYSAVKHDLGLCPNYAYGAMIKKCLDSYHDGEFWQKQLAQDLWIHNTMEQICK